MEYLIALAGLLVVASAHAIYRWLTPSNRPLQADKVGAIKLPPPPSPVTSDTRWVLKQGRSYLVSVRTEHTGVVPVTTSTARCAKRFVSPDEAIRYAARMGVQSAHHMWRPVSLETVQIAIEWAKAREEGDK